MFYVMRHNCCRIYMFIYVYYVHVYCKMFMMYQTIQEPPNKEILDLRILDQTPIIYDLKKPINSSRHLIPQLARTKASLICLVRSQQLCSGTMHIRLASTFYSHGNRSISLSKKNKKQVSRSLMPLYHSSAIQICGTVVWWRDIHSINIVYCVCMGSSGGKVDHRMLFNFQHFLGKFKIQNPNFYSYYSKSL